jgi:hypothetical protein
MKKIFEILGISKSADAQQLRKPMKSIRNVIPDKILETNRQKKSSR